MRLMLSHLLILPHHQFMAIGRWSLPTKQGQDLHSSASRCISVAVLSQNTIEVHAKKRRKNVRRTKICGGLKFSYQFLIKIWPHDVKMSFKRHDVMTLWRHHDVMRSSWRYDVIMTLWRNHDDMRSSWRYYVIMTLWRHHDFMTSSWRYDVIMTPWRYDVIVTSLWRHDVIVTSSWRHNVIMLWRHGPKYSYMLDFDLHLLHCPCCTTRL